MKTNYSLMDISMKNLTTFIQSHKRHLCGLTTLLVFTTFAHAAEVTTKQMTFTSPEDAVKELIQTVKEDDANKLIKILGSEAKPVINSGDATEDKANRELFVKTYEESNKLEKESDKKYKLEIGKENWQFPIPLVKESKGWRFDTKAGKGEILNRRIGRNELSTIQAALAYVDAQREYFLENPQKEKKASYALKFLSTKDKRDGLYYAVNEGEKQSPLGELYANAQAKGYGEKKDSSSQQPYYGYYYRILTSQGSAASGGAHDYLDKGQLRGGFALVAWPATYGNSGVMTFIVNQDGVVYEKDLGANTPVLAKKITKYNPDKTWKPVKTVEAIDKF